jgi:hypothetical protein
MKFWERWVIPSNMYGVRSCVEYCNSFLSMNSVWLRPSGQVEDVYNFVLGGPNIDYNKIITSSEEFAKLFYSLTKRTDILFGDFIWVSKYRSEPPDFVILLSALTIFVIRPNIRMVDTLGVGRVFIAGG